VRPSLIARSALGKSAPQPICTLGKNSLIGAPNGSTGEAGLWSTRQRRTTSEPTSFTSGGGTLTRAKVTLAALAVALVALDALGLDVTATERVAHSEAWKKHAADSEEVQTRIAKRLKEADEAARKSASDPKNK
jgi:alpha-D-ribose 1-methylphosphonate 5-triphosphate synthase subunit PhnG